MTKKPADPSRENKLQMSLSVPQVDTVNRIERMKIQEDDPEPRNPRKRQPKARRKEAWGDCEVCGQNLPIVPETGMCGPCTFGEASTLLGDW